MIDAIASWWNGLVNSISNGIDSIINYFLSYDFLIQVFTVYVIVMVFFGILVAMKLSVIYADKQFKEKFYDPEVTKLLAPLLLAVFGFVVCVFSTPIVINKLQFAVGLFLILIGLLIYNKMLNALVME